MWPSRFKSNVKKDNTKKQVKQKIVWENVEVFLSFHFEDTALTWYWLKLSLSKRENPLSSQTSVLLCFHDKWFFKKLLMVPCEKQPGKHILLIMFENINNIYIINIINIKLI